MLHTIFFFRWFQFGSHVSRSRFSTPRFICEADRIGSNSQALMAISAVNGGGLAVVPVRKSKCVEVAQLRIVSEVEALVEAFEKLGIRR
ncbi:hypothetical protein L1887_03114 [Cichorium endivia]|nr:hypothetical protein L1887_03114 [Cichorium endivia]